ncbi:hypothetical protein MKEN_00100600 [Mycena kentingensis (nom. inval.)]|nr:hypothetical protein MKEN_00100600 [Mycena kentingensis (nom. inval.)]
MSDSLTTTIHVLNLHCGSCVLSIEQALATLDPSPLSVDVSVVNQSISVTHSHSLPPTAIENAVVDAGFDVDADKVDQSHDHRQKHFEQCTFCRNAQPSSLPPSFCLTLSISGMSCASCVNSITRALEGISGVSNIAVSLLEKSATAKLDQEDLTKPVIQAIEDCGFDAQLISIEPVPGSTPRSFNTSARTISLRVAGMFCPNCPSRAMVALEALGPRVNVLSPFSSHVDPVVELSYEPNAPSLTIRTIIAALEASNDPPFRVSLNKPPSLEDRAKVMHSKEQRRLLYRFLVTLVTAIPTFIIGVVYMSLVHANDPVKMWFMEPIWAGNAPRSSWALFFLSLPVMFYGCGHFHRRSFKEIYALWRPGSKTPILRRLVRFGSMNLLVSMGVSVAFFASVGLLARAATQPRKNQGDTTTYFDSVVFLTLFLLAGRYLEAYSKAKTADAIAALSRLRPVSAQLLVSASTELEDPSEKPVDYDPEKADDNSRLGSERRIVSVPLDLLEIGDIVRCNNGQTPPADGTIVSVFSEETADAHIFDESMLTGESMPVTKYAGDKVFLGSVNKSNTVFIRVDSVGGGNFLDGIVAIVREGATRRAPIERLADLITGYFVPAITLLAVVTWLIWMILGYSGALPDDYLDVDGGGWLVWSLQFSIAVFVVACPCGIGLAAPTALLVGSGLAAKAGILARGGGEAFQELSQVDIIVFDKTGTLTTGADPSVCDSLFPSIATDVSREDLLGMAAALESASSHPLGRAILKYCTENAAKDRTGSQIEETPGMGVRGRFASYNMVLGSQAFVERQNGAVIDPATAETVENWKSQARSVVFVAISSDTSAVLQVAAVFAVSDALRDEAAGVIAWFKKQGVTPWIISGDNPKTTLAVAKQVGIAEEHVIAGILPHEKGEKIEMLQSRPATRSRWFSRRGTTIARSVVAMVGDGINDSVALTVADVGIAIGSGSDVAISSASFILLSSDLRSLATLCKLSGRIMNRVRINFGWACIYNIIALPIAAGCLYPAGKIRLDPVWASLAMALSSVSVVLSSLALRLGSVA